jgi:hypothetical protein
VFVISAYLRRSERAHIQEKSGRKIWKNKLRRVQMKVAACGKEGIIILSQHQG